MRPCSRKHVQRCPFGIVHSSRQKKESNANVHKQGDGCKQNDDTHSGIPHSNANGHTIATHNNMDGSHKWTVEWKTHAMRTRSVEAQLY